MKKQIYSLVGLLILIFSFTACAQKSVSISEDIITQTILSPEKIPVTVLVKYAFSINSFEKEAEKRFPNLDIIQVGNYTCDMGTAEYEARLKNNDLTDIVMTWPLEIGEDYWKDRLLDLSSMPFSSNYTSSAMATISREGKLFYLPGPSQIRGIVYNKTLFAENNWEVPKNFDEFIALCQKIDSTGIRSLQLGFFNAEVLATPLVGFGYADSFSKPQEVQQLADYNQTNKGSFGNFASKALTTFQTLIDQNVLQEKDLTLSYSDREQMLFNREAAMIEDSVLMARMGFNYNGCTDDFGLMPFFNPDDGGDWARLYPVCYIGLNKNLAESQNKEKYQLVNELMSYISSAKGQHALAGDTGAMLSALNGVSPPDMTEIKDLLPAIEHGRCGVFPTLKNAQDTLQSGLAKMVKGELTKEEVIKNVDAENTSPTPIKPLEVLGRASEDFSLIETGNFLTDIMREKSGCEIALFLDNGKDGKFNGKGISARFYKGDQTESDVKRVLPDLKHNEKAELWKVSMTGEDLLKTLEYSIPVENNRTGWFYYFSGLKMTYAPAAEPGKRIRKITDDQGKAIDPQGIYSIAVMDNSSPEEFFKSCEKTRFFINDLLSSAIKDQKTIRPSGDQRFVIAQP